MVTIGDENLAEELQRGNEQALRYLIDRYGGRIHGMVRRMMAQMPNDWEDCLNEIFLAVWTHCDSYDAERAAFESWLMAVAKYQILKYIRDHRRIPMENIDEVPEASERDAAMTVFDETEYEEFRNLLRALPERDRSLFTDLFWHEHTYEEIRQKTGESRSSLYTRVSRGKKRLREEMEHERKKP